MTWHSVLACSTHPVSIASVNTPPVYTIPVNRAPVSTAPHKTTPALLQDVHVFMVTPQGTCQKQAGALAAARLAHGTAQGAAVPAAAEAALGTAVPRLADVQATDAGLRQSCESEAEHNL